MYAPTNATTEPVHYNLVVNTSCKICDIISGRQHHPPRTTARLPAVFWICVADTYWCDPQCPGLSCSQCFSVLVSLHPPLLPKPSLFHPPPQLSHFNLGFSFLKFDVTRPPPSHCLISSPARPPSSPPSPYPDLSHPTSLPLIICAHPRAANDLLGKAN